MIRKINYLLFFLLTVLLVGCKKYLDVKPEDSYTDEQVYSNSATVRQALNGLYNGLTANELYGASLTMEAMDILAGRYNMVNVDNDYLDIYDNYTRQGAAGSTFDALWSGAYALVLKTNTFITQLNKTSGVVTSAQQAQLLGEATAIRAFIQFDLLRLYGPQYIGEDSTTAIPYYTGADAKVHPLLSFGQIIQKILDDLSAAEKLLAGDPIISNGVGITTGTVDFYSNFRNRRFNYYAVKALQARVHLYAGHKDEAHAAALAVVTVAGHIFPWTPYTNVINNANPDRIFSDEVIFGVDNRNLYTLYNQFYSPSLTFGSLLAPTDAQLTAAYEGNENDYRYTSSWLYSPSSIRTFIKYADLTDQSKTWRYFEPLIRKSEMYYILAETDPDPAQAVSYLNQVRYNRGLPDLPDNAPLTGYGGEIEKEYIKEFYGEGQLFFYYKRINPWWKNISNYTVPLPISETNLR